MRKLIPQAVIAVVAEHVANVESHTTLDSLFMYAGCPGSPPQGSKQAKALAWLRTTNTDESVTDPLSVLGRIIESYMDSDLSDLSERHVRRESTKVFRARLGKALAISGLQYASGGMIFGGLASATQTLAKLIKERNEPAISQEFERAARKAESEPREAVSAAANILESICKCYIEDKGLSMPSKQVLSELWAVVRKDLGFDPSQLPDDDLKGIVSGLIQVVQGLAAFRTHASSAHGAGPRAYRLQPRHSRLAVHAAHTAALFILESWHSKKTPNL
jgi:hypothetical protein